MELWNNWYKADKGKHFVLTQKGKEECATVYETDIKAKLKEII